MVQNSCGSKVEYEQLSSARVSNSRNVVVSRCSRGGFTVAQQVVIEDDGHEMTMFMKGAYHVKDLDALIALRDAIDLAIDKTVRREEADEEELGIEWD